MTASGYRSIAVACAVVCVASGCFGLGMIAGHHWHRGPPGTFVLCVLACSFALWRFDNKADSKMLNENGIYRRRGESMSAFRRRGLSEMREQVRVLQEQLAAQKGAEQA